MHVNFRDDFSGLANAWKYFHDEGSNEVFLRMVVFLKNHG